MKKGKNRIWILMIAAILVFAVGALIWQHVSAKHAAESSEAVIAEIYSMGKCVQTIDLSAVKEPMTFEVEGKIGVNTVLVEPGRVCITDAECPDHVCISMGWLSAERPFPIVCLPNEVVIQLRGDTEHTPQLDGVTG